MSTFCDCLNVMTLLANCYERNDVNSTKEMTLHHYFFLIFGISSKEAFSIYKS